MCAVVWAGCAAGGDGTEDRAKELSQGAPEMKAEPASVSETNEAVPETELAHLLPASSATNRSEETDGIGETNSADQTSRPAAAVPAGLLSPAASKTNSESKTSTNLHFTAADTNSNLAPTGPAQNQNPLQPVQEAESSKRYENSNETLKMPEVSRNRNQEEAAATNESGKPPQNASTGGSAINLDAAFLKMVAESSLADIKFAKLGEQRADSKDLKDWCDEKKRDAGDDLKYVKWLAHQKAVSLPDEPNLEHQIALKQLEDYSDRGLAAQFLSDSAELLGQTEVAVGKLHDPEIQSAAKDLEISHRSKLRSEKDKAEKIGLGKGLVQEIVRVQLEATGAATLSPDLLPASLAKNQEITRSLKLKE